ncbi:MAG: Ca-activated chloride channel family protein, partial [Candidatus Binatia bacterium]
TQFTAAALTDGGQRWKDAGYWLTPVIALLALIWFRPGWSVQWNTAAIVAACLFLGSNTSHAGDKLFSTQDQSAQRLFNSGGFSKAAVLFTEPMRQGVAWFKAGDFKRAAAAFGRTGTAEGLYNRGNAMIMLGEYDAAITSYEAALKMRADWKEAKANLNLAKLRLARLMDLGDDQSQKSNSQDEGPDDIVFDERTKKQANASTEVIAGEGQELSDAALRAQWLRRVQTKPAEYLKLKFLYQHKVAQAESGKEVAK